MKKALSLLVLVLLCCFVLVGCNMLCSNGIVNHAYDSVVTNATCAEDGYTTHTCKYCGDSYTDSVVEAFGHTEREKRENEVLADCENGGKYDKVTYCPDCGAELSRKTLTTSPLGHEYEKTMVEPTDTECGYTLYSCQCGKSYKNDFTAEKSASVGLEFGDTVYGYAVVGIGSCTDTDIVIPSYHDGKDIMCIYDEAFYGQTQITSVKIPDGVQTIGLEAFSGCTSLKSVEMSNWLFQVFESAFYNCVSLDAVYIKNLTNWCEVEFDNVFSNPLFYAGNLYINGELFTEFNLPKEITELRRYTFAGLANVETIVVPEGVEIIGEAFYHVKAKRIEFPSTVLEFRDCVLYGSEITEIAYNGTMEEWYIIYTYKVTYNMPATEVECTDGNFDLTPYK